MQIAEKVPDTFSVPAWGSDVPDSVVALEFGPMGDTSQGSFMKKSQNVIDLGRFFAGAVPPSRNWEDFIKETTSGNEGWELDQYNTSGFDLSSLLSTMKTKGHLAVCYGPTKQGDNMEDKFRLAALRAQKIVGGTPPSDWILEVNRFSKVRLDFESAALTHVIPAATFKPHDTACTLTDVCPSCN